MTYNYKDGANYPRGWKKPTELTIDEAIRMEPEARRIAGDYAIGKYQFKPDTMRELKGRMGLKGSEIMTPEMQDRMAETLLLQKRGFYDFVDGRMSTEAFQAELAKEWASLPKDATDVSHYRTPARIPTKDLLPVLQQTKEAGSVLDHHLDGGYLPPK
jgi:muramidase (phage lysozyme)